jgi:hypothetical protein
MKFKVWSEELVQTKEEHALDISAYSYKHAAEKWAALYDGDVKKYSIVPVVACVLKEGADTPVKFMVVGKPAMAYRAKILSEPE